MFFYEFWPLGLAMGWLGPKPFFFFLFPAMGWPTGQGGGSLGQNGATMVAKGSSFFLFFFFKKKIIF